MGKDLFNPFTQRYGEIVSLITRSYFKTLRKTIMKQAM